MLFFLLLPASARPQGYAFQHLTTKDGLASDITKFIFQDRKGFYWIGNGNGFQKFDGKNFSSTSFGNQYIRSQVLDDRMEPAEDKEGNVYIPNQGAVYVYHPSGKTDTLLIPLYDNSGLSLCKDEQDNIWIATHTNLYKYDKLHHACVLWMTTGEQKITGSFCGLLYDGHAKGLWLAKDDAVFLIDIARKRITQPFITPDSNKADLPHNNTFTTFWMDSHYNLWIGSWNGNIYKYNTLTYQKEVLDGLNSGNKNRVNKSVPICFAEDRQHRIWIGCLYGGLFVYNAGTNLIDTIATNNNIPNAFHCDYTVFPLFLDKEGNIWAGTDEGINVFNPSPPPFINMDENSVGATFHNPDVTAVFQTRSGDVLVGSWGKGVWLFDSSFRLKQQFYDSTIQGTQNGEYRKNYAWCFTEDFAGKVWIGYQHGLLGIFDRASGQIAYREVPQFNKKTIMVTRCDAHGNIWFGLHSGVLGKWDAARHIFLTYPHPPQQLVYEETINDILPDRQDRIWIASEGNGFYCFDAATERYTGHFINEGKTSPCDNTVNTLTPINDSVIGLSNKFIGFSLFNKNSKAFVSYDKQNGQPLHDVYGIANDRQNNTWIATKQGLLRMNSRDKKTISFDEEDGLLMNRFQGGITRLRDGRLAIPAETGFVVFSPDQVNRLPAPPDVTITGFSVFDQPLLLDSALAHNSVIHLNHDQNFITISFASISFANRNSTQYHYKLEGVNRDWITTHTQRSADYSNLDPGDYMFQVKCENRDGLASAHTSTLLIHISPPLWATWWAYAVYALIAAAIIYAIYYNRIQQLRKKQAAQLHLMIATQEEERKRISRDLHDDVGTRLSALKLFLSSLHEKAAGTGNEDIKRLAASSGQFVSETIADVRDLLLNLSPSVLEEFGYTTAVEGLISKINETKQIHFSLVIFGMTQRLSKEPELALYRITQELINNVLKHAEAKHVSLQIGKRDHKIILLIEDDGKGFDITAHANGYGLHNLDARTRLLHGTLTIDSQPGKGTSALVEIPDTFI